jgi:hypothetical protein
MGKLISGLKLLTTKGEVVDAILYCHQETIRLGTTTYYLLKKDTPADASGTTLSVSTATVGAWVWGKFAFPLAGIAKILSGTIYATYRAYTGGGTVNAQIDIYPMDSTGVPSVPIATGVSKSANLGTSWATYTGASYDFPGYTVTDQSYYLRIDYIANVTVKKAGQYAYLRIDDQTLDLADQTRSQDWSFITETIVAENYPMLYLSKPIDAQMLISKVEGATVSHVAKDFPEVIIKSGKAQELRSKFTV